MHWFDHLPPDQREAARKRHEVLVAMREDGDFLPPDESGPSVSITFEPIDASGPDDWVFTSEDWSRTHDCIGVFSPYRLDPATPPTTLSVPHADTVTNARIKRYMAKDVLQVANTELFPTGDFEMHHSKRKRLYDVSRPGEAADPERSLSESKRRAKSKVRDIALCNRFTHMFTWTLDPDLIDRYNAKAIYKKVRVFLTNATQRKGFRYVCIPEYHTLKEGETRPAIHMHGLCVLGDVQTAPAHTPSGQPICDNSGREVLNMTDWTLGFSTCVRLDSDYEKAVNYVCKYITKAESKIFGKWYLSSRSLQKAPDIIPVEPINYDKFRDEQKIAEKQQTETNVYRDVMIVSEEYKRDGVHGL